MSAQHRAWVEEQADKAKLQSIASTLSAKNVEAAFLDCLFRANEPIAGYIPVHGLTMNVGFHPDRLKSKREQIRTMLKQLEAEFFPHTGGGMSFLRMPFCKDGRHWGGHRDCERLLLLALGLGEASFTMPKEMWSILPGGVPYITFKA